MQQDFSTLNFPGPLHPTTRPPYTIWWEHIWPVDIDWQKKITGEDLPHILPGAHRTPPCTVRYILPSPFYNSDNAAENICHEIFQQLHNTNQSVALDAEVIIPSQTNQGATKQTFLDITVSTPQLFHILKDIPLSIDKHQIEQHEKGIPVPANILTVAIKHLPAATDIHNMGAKLANALERYNTTEIEVWDVYARHIILPYMPENPKFCGSIFAAVRFKNCSANEFPHSFVRYAFPGFIKIYHQVYPLEYAGKIDHCWKCKERAKTPHERKECPYLKCWHCGQTGHSRRNCPSYTGEETYGQHMLTHTDPHTDAPATSSTAGQIPSSIVTTPGPTMFSNLSAELGRSEPSSSAVTQNHPAAFTDIKDNESMDLDDNDIFSLATSSPLPVPTSTSSMESRKRLRSSR